MRMLFGQLKHGALAAMVIGIVILAMPTGSRAAEAPQTLAPAEASGRKCRTRRSNPGWPFAGNSWSGHHHR